MSSTEWGNTHWVVQLFNVLTRPGPKPDGRANYPISIVVAPVTQTAVCYSANKANLRAVCVSVQTQSDLALILI